jgi:hypothetical protein
LTEDEYRHQCLVRWIIRKRLEDKDAAHRFLHGYHENGKHKNGWNDLHPESTLERDSIDQWNLGNRGKDGEWK